MELTVIGDTVNLASRVEGLTKAYGTGILFTDSARASSGTAAGDSRSVDRIRVVGRKQAVDLFTMWDADVSLDARRAYEKGVQLYRDGGFSEASGIFRALQSERPDDPLCALYAGRCAEWIANPPQGPWDGISQAKSK
jgi:adenylate cyclase